MIVTVAKALNESDDVAIAISKPLVDQSHCGAIYRDANGELRTVHLAFHFALRDERTAEHDTCVPVSLSSDVQLTAAVYLGAIKAGNPQIPYGISTDGVAFDAQGKFIAGPIGSGLTCATFVQAAYKAIGLPIVDETTWPQRESDKMWRDKMVGLMEKLKADYEISAEHIEAVRNDPVAWRLRPEEVAAASTRSAWPVNFPEVDAIAAQVLADFEQQ